ncbi:hypothetical protein AAV99_11465 [Aurantiacibacter marinus]|uniref:BioF2-like acetyltransferase domain-containing protein n=1 Tax=Aurantiacibacter marinus TaxID=874156 RepID=A0A0H0XSY5_9SPHN|nr:hypothetical protein AAV99_11465 [Aurantiacibacter marinus]
MIELRAQDWRTFTDTEDIAAWDALAKTAAEPNPFYESWNLLPALEEFDRSGLVELWLLKADGQLVGLVPMKRDFRYYGYSMPHWCNWTHANCFLGAPLIVRGFERVFWSHLLARADHHAGLSLFLHLALMPGTGPLHLALSAEIRQSERARPAATVVCEERAALVSRASPKAYFEESLSTKKRKELRRQQRRLEDEGDLTLKRLKTAEGLTHWIDNFLDLEHRGWKGKAGSALACDPRTARLFTYALEGAARRGQLLRLSLLLDGKPIAMLANFICAPGAFSYKTTFDEDYSRFSPGVLLQRENLDILEDDTIAWVDSCAAQDHPMIDHFWRERRIIAGHSIGIGGIVRRRVFSAAVQRETGRPAKGIL